MSTLNVDPPVHTPAEPPVEKPVTPIKYFT